VDVSLTALAWAAAPAIIAALLPRKYSYFAFGWYTFLLASLYLEYLPPLPFAAKAGAERADDWLWLAARCAAAAFALRKAVDLVRRTPPPRLNFDQRFLLSWEFPIGIVLAMLAFHGLSEVMAGFRPAWLAHLLVTIGIGIGFAILVRYYTVLVEAPPVTAMLLAMVFLVVMTSHVAGSASHAWILSGRASRFADGAPYCLLAFDRAGNPRPATSTFDLSPLVMRSRGSFAVHEEAWLIVQTRWGPVSYAYTYGPRWFVVAQDARKGPTPCTPS
jgi:hypothetical protein